MTVQPNHSRDEFLGGLAAFVGQNSLASLATDLDKLLGVCAAAELRAAAVEVRHNHGTASLSAKRIDARADALAGGGRVMGRKEDAMAPARDRLAGVLIWKGWGIADAYDAVDPLLPMIERIVSERQAAILDVAARAISDDGDAASAMEYDELAGGHYRSVDYLRNLASAIWGDAKETTK